MTMTNLAAIDVGYNQVKARTTKGVERTVFPAVISPAWEPQFQTNINGVKRAHICYDNREYFLAEHALAHSPLAGQTVNRDRIYRPEYVVLFLAALAHRIPAAQTRKIRLVTGLPNSEIGDREEVQARLLGTHQIMFNNRDYRYDIEKIVVIPQALGILLREAFRVNRQGVVDFRDSRLLKQVNMFIDIGGRTVNYMMMNGTDLIEELSRSQSLGMYRVLDMLQAEIEKRYRIQISLADLDLALRDEGQKITIQGQQKPIGRFLQPILETVAEAIAQNAMTVWRDTNADNLIIAGGGAHHLGGLLSDKLKHPNTRVVPSPHLAIVDGMWYWGAYLDKTDGWSS